MKNPVPHWMSGSESPPLNEGCRGCKSSGPTFCLNHSPGYKAGQGACVGEEEVSDWKAHYREQEQNAKLTKKAERSQNTSSSAGVS